MWKNHLIRSLPACLILLTMGACAPFATYPPVEGAIGIDNPRLDPVPTIMADALLTVHGQYGGGRPDFAFNLPENTPPDVYDAVIRRMGAGRPMTDPDEWGYHLIQIRSRGLDAEADIVIPREDGPAGLATVRLRKGVQPNYRAQSTKVWNIPVDVPPPHYAPAATRDTRLSGERAEH